jgi:hypothetical protein
MFPFNNSKIAYTFICFGLIFNSQVFAQIKSSNVSCLDEANSITYTAEFQGKTVILVLKGHTYRIPYVSSHVDSHGLRWSVYRNKEIHLASTLPYEKWVSLFTVNSKELIAFAHCNNILRLN